MAIQVLNHSMELSNGLTISEFYIRISVSVSTEGNKLRINSETYLDKNKYTEGKRLSVPVRFTRNLDYNRETDGVDILKIAHDNIKADLEKASIPSEKINIVDITL